MKGSEIPKAKNQMGKKDEGMDMGTCMLGCVSEPWCQGPWHGHKLPIVPKSMELFNVKARIKGQEAKLNFQDPSLSQNIIMI